MWGYGGYGGGPADDRKREGGPAGDQKREGKVLHSDFIRSFYQTQKNTMHLVP